MKMKKVNLIKKLKSIGIDFGIESKSFKLDTKSELGTKNIDVRFQSDEVLFFAYENYGDAIIFDTLNQVLKHWNLK